SPGLNVAVITRTVCFSSFGNPSTPCCSTRLGFAVLGAAAPCDCAKAGHAEARPAKSPMRGARLLRTVVLLDVARRWIRREKSLRAIAILREPQDWRSPPQKCIMAACSIGTI